MLPEFIILALPNKEAMQWDMIRYDTLECAPYLKQNEADAEKGIAPYLVSGWWTEFRRHGVPEYVRVRKTWGYRVMPKYHPLHNRELFYKMFPKCAPEAHTQCLCHSPRMYALFSP